MNRLTTEKRTQVIAMVEGNSIRAKGQTPAMAAGVTDHRWTLPEMIAPLDATEKAPRKRGPYKKRPLSV